MANVGKGRNIIINNVTLFWPKLARAVENQFNGEMQYEVQGRVSKKRRAEFEEFGKVKEQDDGTVSFNFKKKAVKSDGSAAAKVGVVDEEGNAVDPMSIGNGTKANIRLLLNDYQIKNPKTQKVTKEGTSAMIVEVQVTDLVVYEGGNSDSFVGFEYKGGKKAGKKVVEESEETEEEETDAEETETEEEDNVETVSFAKPGAKKAAAKAPAKKVVAKAPVKAAAKKVTAPAKTVTKVVAKAKPGPKPKSKF
jgi:hypothetical protein